MGGMGAGDARETHGPRMEPSSAAAFLPESVKTGRQLREQLPAIVSRHG